MKNKTTSVSLTIPENVLSFYRLEADSMQVSLSSLISSMLAKKIEGINLDLLNAMGHEYLPEFIALAEAAKGNDGEFDTDIKLMDDMLEAFRDTYNRLLAYDDVADPDEQTLSFHAMHIAGQCWWINVEGVVELKGFWAGSADNMVKEYSGWCEDVLDLMEESAAGANRYDCPRVKEFNDWAYHVSSSKRYVWVPDNEDEDDEFAEFCEPKGEWVMTGAENV